MPYIDLTHPFTPNMPVYPGDPKPKLEQIASINHQGYCDYQVTTNMHVGTHLDGPAHMVDNGRHLVDFPVDRFFGRGILIDARERSLDVRLLEEKMLQKGDIVLICTGWSGRWGEERYFSDYPPMGLDLVQALVDAQVKMVGLDTPGPDSDPFPVHKRLLQNEILILENLTNLSALVEVPDFEVLALPMKFETDSAPVRVVARL